MLTGFLLTTATVRHFRRTGQLDWGPFFARRLLRVWPVLVATTLLLYALGFPPGCEPSRFGFWSNWLLIANFAGDSCKASRAPRARAAAGTAPSATHAVASAVNTHTHTHIPKSHEISGRDRYVGEERRIHSAPSGGLALSAELRYRQRCEEGASSRRLAAPKAADSDPRFAAAYPA